MVSKTKMTKNVFEHSHHGTQFPVSLPKYEVPKVISLGSEPLSHTTEQD